MEACPSHRLVGFNRTSGLTQSWNLSPVGDWNSVTTNGTAQTRTHGPTHELLSSAGQAVSTDVKGNITFIPATLRPTASSLTSVWDFDNRLREGWYNEGGLTGTGSVYHYVTHVFDALGRRVGRKYEKFINGDRTTGTLQGTPTYDVYVQSGQQTIADYVAGAIPTSPTYRYVYASYIDEPVMRFKPSGSESLYYHRNQQYSVIALTNASKSIVERYAYSAYGVPTITNASGTVLPVGSVNNRYMYTGREWDSVIAQYHYRARMYDANLGRFASRDPIGYGDGVNQYSSRFASGYLDAFGETAIRVGKLNVDLPKTCGSSNSVRWTFKVDKKGDNRNGPCANGYEGYLIQFVEQWCFKKDCKTCDNCPKLEERTDWFLSEGFPSEAAEHFSYYEAWNVTKAGNVIDISNFTDKAMVDVKNETCGFTNQIGTIRFYCKEDVSLNGWHPGSNNPGSAAYYGKICPTTPLALPSIGGEAPPGFWGTPPIAEAPAQPDDIGVLQAGRFLFSDWDCCDPDKWVAIEYGPKKSL